MIRIVCCFLALVASGISLWPQPAEAGEYLKKQLRYPRVRAAEKRYVDDVKADFRKAGAQWPPAGVFLRAFKGEGLIELWAAPRRGRSWVKVRDFEICMASGVLGPKVQSGDMQVPEGFYHVDRFNPASRFHLSLGLNYPNAVDRTRSGRRPPGGDIFIHGDCVTIGCMPLEDGPMSYLYVAAVHSRDAGQRRLPVHVFPCRMDQPLCKGLRSMAESEDDSLRAFWDTLEVGYAAFEASKVPPVVRATARGYQIRE
ncbi:MAG: murein L,D-transpeptidase family protein [Bradymonadia bacterium]